VRLAVVDVTKGQVRPFCSECWGHSGRLDVTVINTGLQENVLVNYTRQTLRFGISRSATTEFKDEGTPRKPATVKFREFLAPIRY
jgi:hypothetical protein